MMMRPRLHAAALARVEPGCTRPAYDRTRLPVGSVHLGLGAFAQAHLLAFTDDALDQAFGPFGVCGVSLMAPVVRDRLLPQDGLYTVAERGGGPSACG
jgi:fructuronate reductase